MIVVIRVLLTGFLEVSSRLDFEEGKGYREVGGEAVEAWQMT